MNLGDSVRDRDQLCCLLTATASHRLFQKNLTENTSVPAVSGPCTWPGEDSVPSLLVTPSRATLANDFPI